MNPRERSSRLLVQQAKRSRLHYCLDPVANTQLREDMAGNAEYIVSGDPDLLAIKSYRGIRVLTPAMFLALLEYKKKAA